VRPARFRSGAGSTHGERPGLPCEDGVPVHLVGQPLAQPAQQRDLPRVIESDVVGELNLDSVERRSAVMPVGQLRLLSPTGTPALLTPLGSPFDSRPSRLCLVW
jgi:hypothetical protein